MSIAVAVILSAITSLISLVVGIYLRRYKEQTSEMMGMMIGMTFGMMTGIVVGYFIGCIQWPDNLDSMARSNFVGVLVGMGYGAAFGKVGGLMGMMDGSMGGLMGGMMGAMLGVMINTSDFALWGTAVFMFVIDLVVMAALIRLVRQHAAMGLAIDPVCKMQVDVATARWTSTLGGQTYYFCAPACKRDFDKSPEKYGAVAPAPAGELARQ